MKNKMFLKIKNKLSSKSGVSLGELLVCMLIILLVSAGVASGTTFGLDQYNKSMMQSESKMLCSTLESTITNILSNTDKIKLGGKKTGSENDYELVAFYSSRYVVSGESASSYKSGFYAADIVREGVNVNMTPSTGGGEIIIGYLDDTGTNLTGNKLLSSSAYSTYKLRAAVEAYYDVGIDIYHVFLTVYDSVGNVLVTEPFDVLPLSVPVIEGGARPDAVYSITYNYGVGPNKDSLNADVKKKTVKHNPGDRIWGNTDIPAEWNSSATLLYWKVSGRNRIFNLGDTVTPNSNLSLDAVWGYPVTYDLGGGLTFTDFAVYDQNITLASPINLVDNTSQLPVGYSFVNWSTGSGGSVTEYNAGASVKILGSMTFNANWQECYTIVFHNGNDPISGIVGYVEPQSGGGYNVRLDGSTATPFHADDAGKSPEDDFAWNFAGWYYKDLDLAAASTSEITTLSGGEIIKAEHLNETAERVVDLYAGFMNTDTVYVRVSSMSGSGDYGNSYIISSRGASGDAWAMSLGHMSLTGSGNYFRLGKNDKDQIRISDVSYYELGGDRKLTNKSAVNSTYVNNDVGNDIRWEFGGNRRTFSLFGWIEFELTPKPKLFMVKGDYVYGLDMETDVGTDYLRVKSFDKPANGQNFAENLSNIRDWEYYVSGNVGRLYGTYTWAITHHVMYNDDMGFSPNSGDNVFMYKQLEAGKIINFNGATFN